MTQNQQLLEYFKSGSTICDEEARRFFDIRNLPGRINELKNLGHVINGVKAKDDKGKWIIHYHYVRFNPDYVKPEPINNKTMLDLIKKYVIAKAEQLNQVYQSRFKAGKVTEASRDAMLKRHRELISFVQSLK